jgi:myo-inositol-1-phosphate synthase
MGSRTSSDARCAFVNAIPVFIASQTIGLVDSKEHGLPIIAMIKSQVGATILHRKQPVYLLIE